MSKQLTTEDAKQSLNAHVAAKGAEIYEKYGPNIGYKQLQAILEDRSCVRYPCKLTFDSSELAAGEFAHPRPESDNPEDGFIMMVHPKFMTELSKVPYLVLYQLVLVNYGSFASSDDAEVFGANALGIDQETYYSTLCEMADDL